MSAAQLMELPKQAQENFEKSAEEFQQLKDTCEAQKKVLLDITNSIPKIEDAQKELNTLDEQIARTNAQIQDVQNLLFASLQGENEEDNSSEVGQVLKTLLNKFTQELLVLASEAADEGQMSVVITSFMELEREINQTIEVLKKNDMFPESNEQESARISVLNEHTQKVLAFMQQILSQNKAE